MEVVGGWGGVSCALCEHLCVDVSDQKFTGHISFAGFVYDFVQEHWSELYDPRAQQHSFMVTL